MEKLTHPLFLSSHNYFYILLRYTIVLFIVHCRLKELMEEVETLKAERTVIESELKNTAPDMKIVFQQAAANGSLNEPLISAQSLGKTFGPLQQQVITREGWTETRFDLLRL